MASANSTPVRPVRRGSSYSTPSVNRPASFRSKFSVSYEALLSGEHPWLATPGTASSSISGTPSIATSSTFGAAAPSGSYFSSPSGKKPSAPRVRFYADLLCLKVEPRTIEQALDAVSSRQLTNDDENSKGARIRENVGSLWRECLRVWTDVPNAAAIAEDMHGSPSALHVNASDEVRRVNAIDTLIALSKGILAKNFAHSSSSLDLIWIFAGGIDEADDVFEDLVSAIDEGLRGELDNVLYQRRTTRPSRLPSAPDQDASLHHQQRAASLNANVQELPTLIQLLYHRLRAVHLAIVWISHASATNLSAYFIRRDLFVGACSLLNAVQSIFRSTQVQPDGSGGLADEDAELLRRVVRDTTLLIGLLAGLGQSGSLSGSGFSSGVKSVEATIGPYFRRMCDWVDSASMQLIRDATAMELDQTWKAYLDNDNSSAATAQGVTASLGALTEGLKKLSVVNANDSEGLSLDLPPHNTSVLLPVYLLCRANQVIVEVLLKNDDPRRGVQGQVDDKEMRTNGSDSQKASFIASLLTLSSYLATHASLNDRSKSYSRLALLIHLTLLNSSAGVAALLMDDRADDVTMIKTCSQRSGPLPMRSIPSSDPSASSITSFFAQLNPLATTSHSGNAQRQQLMSFVLDVCVQYLRHNLRKRLDTSGYLICLQVVLLCIQTCSDQRVQIAYSDWPDVWAAVNSTIAFLVGRHTELRGVEIGKLGQALISVLSLALMESDRFLTSRQDVNVLIYELVRSSEALRRLASIVATGKDPFNNDAQGSPSLSSPSLGSVADSRAIAAKLPVWRLLDLTLVNFDDRLREWSEKKGSRGVFGLNFSLSSVSSYSLLGRGSSNNGTNTPPVGESVAGAHKGSRPSSSQGASTPNGSTQQGSFAGWSGRMPDVQTVLQLISTMDLEQIIQVYRLESERRGGGGAMSSSNGRGGGQGGGSGSAHNGGIASLRSLATLKDARKGILIDEEWLERAESQCLAEAFRFASDDMRALLSSLPS